VSGARLANDATGNSRWLTPGVGAVGAASFFSDAGHEVTTSVLPAFLTGTLGASSPHASSGDMARISRAGPLRVGSICELCGTPECFGR
jgi:hypothetical protein